MGVNMGNDVVTRFYLKTRNILMTELFFLNSVIIMILSRNGAQVLKYHLNLGIWKEFPIINVKIGIQNSLFFK